VISLQNEIAALKTPKLPFPDRAQIAFDVAEARCCCSKLHLDRGAFRVSTPCPACPIHGDNAEDSAVTFGRKLTGGGPLTYPD